MLNAEHIRWRDPSEAPTRRERLMGIIVRMEYRVTKLLVTADTRFWRVNNQNYWGPPRAAMPIVWEDIGAEVIAWAVKRRDQRKEVA